MQDCDVKFSFSSPASTLLFRVEGHRGWGLREYGVENYNAQLDSCLTHMGSCQNYGPSLGTLNNRCRIIIGTQKGTIILTTTHI